MYKCVKQHKALTESAIYHLKLSSSVIWKHWYIVGSDYSPALYYPVIIFLSPFEHFSLGEKTKAKNELTNSSLFPSLLVFYHPVLSAGCPIFFVPFTTDVAKKPFDVVVAFSLTSSPFILCFSLSNFLVTDISYLLLYLRDDYTHLSFPIHVLFKPELHQKFPMHPQFPMLPSFFPLIGKICNCISSTLILKVSNPPMFFLICHTPLLHSYLLVKWAHSQRS